MPERAARANAERRDTATTRRPPRPVLVASDGQLTRASRAVAADGPASVAAERAPGRRPSGNAVPGRRTVVIRGQVADRYSPRRRPQRSAGVAAGYYRPRPERAAKWAVLLGFLLVVVALVSAHL